MGLASFLVQLHEHGNVKVGAVDGPHEDDETIVGVLQEIEAGRRLDMAHDPPVLIVESALWAAQMLYRGCQYLTYREIEEDQVRRGLANPCPQPASPDVMYSADLTLRFLPDLFSLARGVAADDPLVVSLLRLAREWPLSSVGIPGVGTVEVSRFWNQR
ncbi:MAG: hypothetical protein GY953_34965, partial [bacterium]|nr:hypothetical protein [bacterium]